MLAFRVRHFRDAKAFDALYSEFGGQLHRYISHKVPRAEDAEELTAELFLRCWEYMTTSNVDHVQAFFYQVARNLIADFYRRRKPQESLNERDADVVGHDSLESEVEGKLQMEKLVRALARLKPEYKEVISLRFFSQLSIDEIALILQKSTNSVRVLIHRAKQALKKYEEKS